MMIKRACTECLLSSISAPRGFTKTFYNHSADLQLVGWKDSRDVYLLTNAVGNELDGFVQRNTSNGPVQVPCPVPLRVYNDKMGTILVGSLVLAMQLACLQVELIESTKIRVIIAWPLLEARSGTCRSYGMFDISLPCLAAGGQLVTVVTLCSCRNAGTF